MNNNSLLLIQAPYTDAYGPMRKASGTYFPLGLGYISSYVKQHGYDVRFIDPNIQNITLDDIGWFILKEKPILAGISFMTPQFYSAAKIVEVIKQANPETSIALGGAHPSAMPARTLQEIPKAYYVIFEEGEETMLALLDFLSKKKENPQEIAGLAWRSGEKIIVNRPRERIRNLDSLPFPDRSLADQSLYKCQSFLRYYRKSISIFTSRGCPARCAFCASGHKLGAPIRMRSVSNILAEIDFLKENYDIDYLLIKDDNFTLDKKRVKEFCEGISKKYPHLKWHCMARIDTLDYDILSTMKKLV